MKVVGSSKKQDNRKPKKKKHRRLKPSFVAIFCLLIVSVTVALSMTVWFKIEKISCVGESIYTEDEIVSASGIYLNSNLIILPATTIEKRIETQLPYIKKAEVKRELPSGVKIEVIPNTEAYSATRGEEYLVLDDEYKILKTVAEKPQLMLIGGVNSEGVTVGNNLFVNDSDKKDLFEQINLLIASKQINATLVNLENIVDIQIIIEDRLVILLGNTDNLENKLSLALATLDSSNENYISPNETGVINLKFWSESNNQAIFRKGSIEEYLNPQKNNE